MKADDTTAASMANSCIAGKGTLVVAEDGSAKLTVPIQAITMMGQTVYATDWKVYKGAVGTEATAAEYTTDKDGNVNSITFAIPDKAQDGVYVTMTMAAGRTQDAFLKADYANAEKDAAAVDTSALEATIAQADALDEMAYTKHPGTEIRMPLMQLRQQPKQHWRKKNLRRLWMRRILHWQM